MSDKQIEIAGTSNRYLMKKCMKIPTEIKLRKSVSHISSDLFASDGQLSLLSDKNENIIEQIKCKLSSYKQQDVEKKIYDATKIVNLDETFELLSACNLSCYYCSSKLLLLYENVREKSQWTLDRINNDLGHNRDNILIACLECNLKRRNKSKSAFLFTKNLVISKCD